MTNSQTQQEEFILEQSFEALTRDGVRSFTVDSFSQNLGMSKKTIYKYFPSKEDLVDKSVGFFLGLIEFPSLHSQLVKPKSLFFP